MTKASGIFLLIFSIVILACCDESIPEKPSGDDDATALAVFYDTEKKETLQNVADLAISNFRSAMEKAGKVPDVHLRWYNADSLDLDLAFENIGFDESVYAIIAPQHSGQCQSILSVSSKMAEKLDFNKPILLPSATSVELQRLYSELNFVWFLSESNMSQGEMLLAVADSMKYEHINIVARDDAYSRDFADYMPFMANEWNIPVSSVEIVPPESSQDEFADAARKACSDFPDAMTIIASCLQSDYNAVSALGLRNIFFTDAAFPEGGTDAKSDVYGLSLSPLPGSGFMEYYLECTGSMPTRAEAQFYDAIITALLMHYVSTLSGSPHYAVLNDFRCYPSEGQSWTEEGLADIIAQMDRNVSKGLRLSSVILDNDNPRTSSTYFLWSAKGEKVTFERYLDARKYTRRPNKDEEIYEWSPSEMDVDIDKDVPGGKKYVSGGANWALVIAASEGWSNYRHQSDALNMYRILRDSGYDDDHIILIVNDDLAWDPKNIFPGEIFNNLAVGQDLYRNALIDYRTSEISPSLLQNIISPAPEDNIFIYWSGHGKVDGSLCWLSSKNGSYRTLSLSDIDSWVQEMEKKGFNKMMMVIEACYSGKIASAINRPGVLVLTAADAYESSFATGTRNNRLGTFVADEFSLLFSGMIEGNHGISIRDLYHDLYLKVKMSHVTISDYSKYGSLFSSTMKDYLPQ